SEGFRRQVLDFAERKATPIIRFEKGMRKDDVMHKRLRKFKAREGVVFIGIAQEKARVPRTIRKGFGEGEGTIPWIDYATAMVNHAHRKLRGASLRCPSIIRTRTSSSITKRAGAVRACVPKPPSTIPTTSAWSDFWAICARSAS